MKYREYGNTGKKISTLGYGTLRFQRGKKNRDIAVDCLREGIKRGINYIDTAAMAVYGSETLVGEAVKGCRDKVYIATKNHYKGKSLSKWSSYFENSLKSLGTSYIDFYHIHALTWEEYINVLKPIGVIDELRCMKKEGVIKHICFSSHDTPYNIKKIIDENIFEGTLLQYNFIDRQNERIIQYAKSKNMGVGIMGPIGGGRFMESNIYFKQKFGLEINIADFALRFVLSSMNITFALSGMNTLEMLNENIATVQRNLSLTNHETKALNSFKGINDIKCTGCGYCMPCPQMIDIPENFKALRYYKVWKFEKQAKELYSQMKGSSTYKNAGVCVKCGRCIKKCPQKINIINEFEKLHELLDS